MCITDVFQPPLTHPPSISLSVLPTGDSAAGGRSTGGAGHRGRRGPDLHTEGGAGQAAGGAGRYQGTPERNQQPADGPAGEAPVRILRGCSIL